MSELGPGYNPEEVEQAEIGEDLTVESVIEVCRQLKFPEEYIEELKAFESVEEVIATASLWAQELDEPVDIDEFLRLIGAA